MRCPLNATLTQTRHVMNPKFEAKMCKIKITMNFKCVNCILVYISLPLNLNSPASRLYNYIFRQVYI